MMVVAWVFTPHCEALFVLDVSEECTASTLKSQQMDPGRCQSVRVKEMCGLYKMIYGKFAQTQLCKGEEGKDFTLIKQELKIPKQALFRASTSGKCQNCDFSEVNSSQ
jgi:hypothetical protein